MIKVAKAVTLEEAEAAVFAIPNIEDEEEIDENEDDDDDNIPLSELKSELPHKQNQKKVEDLGEESDIASEDEVEERALDSETDQEGEGNDEEEEELTNDEVALNNEDKGEEDQDQESEDGEDEDEESEVEATGSGMTAKDGTQWAATPSSEHQAGRKYLLKEGHELLGNVYSYFIREKDSDVPLLERTFAALQVSRNNVNKELENMEDLETRSRKQKNIKIEDLTSFNRKKELHTFFEAILVVALSEFVGFNDNGEELPSELRLRYLNAIIKTVSAPEIPDDTNYKIDTDQFEDGDQSTSNWFQWSANIYANAKQIAMNCT
ncbi:hypothetical protein RN001_003531 [Aquatica leii]|uniref:Uncharacterized protein n=1 Tax=Aquatica leii TaxID=1421715 RepID=A0AAN7PF71_9COLE|nr:hypothetical protein RN001_003531 [Aquatica leii]